MEVWEGQVGAATAATAPEFLRKAQAGQGSVHGIPTSPAVKQRSQLWISVKTKGAALQEYGAEAGLSTAVLAPGSTSGQLLAPAERILQMWPQNSNATGIKSL